MKKYSICFLLLLCIGGGLAGYFFMGGHQSLSEDEKMYIEEAKPASTKEVTRVSTQLISEVYDEKTQISTKEISNIPASFLGLTRTELIEKLNSYMEDIPLNELNQGLVGYELMYFSPEYIMTRKTYHLPEDFHKYYIRFSRGCLTVYYSDKKTVYEYTDIKLEDLPSDVRAEAISGFAVKDERQLYDFLEAYSS